MPRTAIEPDQATSVLRNGHLVRVAFSDDAAPYLIPLGYAWIGAALCGVGEPGRKTDLASKNRVVAFQVDTSMETGPFEWESVTGTGEFGVVSNPDEARGILQALQPFIAEAPDWWRAEQAPRMAQGALMVWRITPRSYTGIRFAP